MADRGPGGFDQDRLEVLIAVAAPGGRRYPADSWFPGQIPVHEASCAASGKYSRTSGPISQMTVEAAARPMPGMVVTCCLAPRQAISS